MPAEASAHFEGFAIKQIELLHVTTWVIASIYILCESRQATPGSRAIRNLGSELTSLRCALAPAAGILGLSIVSLQLGKRWRGLEKQFIEAGSLADQHSLLVASVEALHRNLRVPTDVLSDQVTLHTVSSYLWSLVVAPRATTRYHRALSRLRFIELRARFVARYNLSPDFPFWAYLNQCKQHVFVRLRRRRPCAARRAR